MAALMSATSISAESLGLKDKMGAIAPGTDADIIAMDGDPLRDPTAARRVVFVMKGGRVYENLASTAKRRSDNNAELPLAIGQETAPRRSK